MRWYLRQLRSLRWDRDFWLFAVKYLLWPPFAWKVSLGLPAKVGRLVRWVHPLIDYVFLAFIVVMLWFSGQALLSQDWYSGIIVLLPLASTLLVLAMRLQLPYRWSYRSEDTEREIRHA